MSEDLDFLEDDAAQRQAALRAVEALPVYELDEGCLSCDFMRDEITTLRTALNREIYNQQWNRGKVRAEFSRVVTIDGQEMVYIHCEPAWGETPEEFEKRYARIREREGARLRMKISDRQRAERKEAEAA